MNIGWFIGLDLNIPLWLIILVAIPVSYYLYMTWHYGMFKKLGIPGPKPTPILGSLSKMMKEGFFAHDSALMEKYGNVVGTFQGRYPLLLVKDLEIIKEVLVKQFSNFDNRSMLQFDDELASNMLHITHGDQWRALRNTLSPTFSRGKMKKLMDHIVETSNLLVENLEDAAPNEPVEFCEYSNAFSMDMIAGTAFGLQLNSQRDRQNTFVELAKKAFNFTFKSPIIIILFFFPFLAPFISLLGITMFPRDSCDFFKNITEQIMEERKGNPQKRTDFIQLMMNAHEEEITEEEKEEAANGEAHVGLKPYSRKRLTKTQIISNALLFFFAGYETTGNILSYVIYTLTVNPECQEKLWQVIEETIGENEPTYEQLHSLPFLDQVLEETLRMYPQTPRLERLAKNDITIQGVHIPRDTLVAVPLRSLHYDPTLWPDPEKFDPDRFLPEKKAERNPYTYLPFGLGPRNCIGMRLAQLEIKVAVVRILQKFKLLQCQKTQLASWFDYGWDILIALENTGKNDRLERLAKNDITIQGVHIPRNTLVTVPLRSLHYDPTLWPDPETFDPDRFLPEKKAERNPYTYLAFGLGPRNFIGMRLAQLEIEVAVVRIL